MAKNKKRSRNSVVITRSARATAVIANSDLLKKLGVPSNYVLTEVDIDHSYDNKGRKLVAFEFNIETKVEAKLRKLHDTDDSEREF